DEHAESAGAGIPSQSAPGSDVHTNEPTGGADVWSVVLFDQFNTPQPDQQRARAELVRFVNALSPRANVALLSFGGALRVVSPFSAGQPGMVKALTDGALQFHPGPLLHPYNADEQFDLQQQLLNHLPPVSARAVRDNRRETEMGELEIRVKNTLTAFSSIAQWLARYPGKKNVYWLSAGFPLTAEPQQFRRQDGVSGDAAFRRDFFELQQRVNHELASARIALFPLDVRGTLGGLREGIDSADIKGAQYAEPGGDQLLSDDIGQDDQRIAQEHVDMLDLARATGGIARFNRNDLADVLAGQFRQGQNFYSVSYIPSNTHYDGKYRKIDLAVLDRDNHKNRYRLSYRHGYFAVAAFAPPQNTIDAFTLALKSGAPPATGLIFTSRFIPRTANGKASISYSIATSGLQFTPTADGGESASVDCAIVEYDKSGTLVRTSQIHVDGHVKPGQQDRVKISAFPAKQEFVLAPETAVLAVGVRDHTTGNFGAIHFAIGH
ncbi:MAG TPA: VWA domain-containing protein, partial [Acidobacteriaceae bacterium]|nr:VWA domain-containing protein [Acidobacteriaceae bacterium]